VVRSGFTMVEIMVVVVIVGLMAGIVTVSWRSTLPSAQLNSTVRVLSERINGTRADAIARNLEYRIYYDIDNDEYWVETPFAVEGGRLAHGDEERQLLFETKLEPTVSFHEITIDGETYNDGVVYVRFDPLGASSDHLIVIHQTIFDRYFSIEVLALTGLVRFHEGLFQREPPRDGDFD
jgi:prepilin-type N-terminal cleavage/methylation domain-containing protein